MAINRPFPNGNHNHGHRQGNTSAHAYSSMSIFSAIGLLVILLLGGVPYGCTTQEGIYHLPIDASTDWPNDKHDTGAGVVPDCQCLSFNELNGRCNYVNPACLPSLDVPPPIRDFLDDDDSDAGVETDGSFLPDAGEDPLDGGDNSPDSGGGDKPDTGTDTGPDPEPEEWMETRIFDVGQANSILLKGPDFTVVIDTGNYTDNNVVSHLNNAGVQTIDLLVGTHPHADHIGQFPQVLGSFAVEEVWLSGDTTTSATFERAISAIIYSGANYRTPRSGQTYQFGSLNVQVLNPAYLTGDMHEGCIALRTDYKGEAMVFMGDVEQYTEWQIIDRTTNLQAKLLLLGHHGSSTSSSSSFLSAVGPDVAVYSAGWGNSYGHPHSSVVSRVIGMGIDLYGTDVNGTITIRTNGSNQFIITPQRGSAR